MKEPRQLSQRSGRWLLRGTMVVVAISLLLPGAAGLLGGPLPVPRETLPDTPLSPDLVSQLRALQALMLGVGVLALWALFAPKKWSVMLVAVFLLLSSLARILAIIQAGWPSAPYVAYLALELSLAAGLLFSSRYLPK